MYFIQESILEQIKATIGIAPIESGGIIGVKNNVICAYCFDEGNVGNIAEYQPDPEKFNSIIRAWTDKRIFFIGIVHSHANSYDKPSLGDKIYANNLMEANSYLKAVVFPIVTKVGARIKVSFYEYDKEGKEFYPIRVKILSNT